MTPPAGAPKAVSRTTTTTPATAAPPRVAGSLLGGYLLVALVAAWCGGIAMRQLGPLAQVGVLAWLGLALAGAGIALVAAALGRGAFARVAATPTIPWATIWRLVLVAGLLLFGAALGAARAAQADPANDPTSIGRFVSAGATVQPVQVRVRGVVALEPDLRTGYRLLTLDTSAVSQDGGQTWQSATGRVEAAWYGPDDWFAPAYGDTLELTGALAPPGASASPDVVAWLNKAHGTIDARGGGNPVFAWLFGLRVALAQAIQHALPEPEAALLIGILLGLKTQTLRARLPLFTTTGTIHLVVPAGLKVSVLATIAADALRPLGRWPRVAGSIAAVALYAALGGSGPPAVRAAIMGSLLVLAGALGRSYNVFTALAIAVLAMTAVEPLVIYDAGFQLTTLATLGLPLLVPPIQARLAPLLLAARVIPAADAVAELLAVTLAAQVATLPVLALTFHLISFVAPLANLLTVPLLAPVMVLGGAFALVVLASQSLPALSVVTLPLASILSWIVWPLLAYIDGVIQLCAALPFAALPIGDLPGTSAAAYYAALALGWRVVLAVRSRLRRGPSPTPAPIASRTTHHQLGRRVVVASLAVALLGSLGASVPSFAAASTARLDFLDLGGGGDAALLRLPSGMTVLIDGGPDGPTLDAALAARLPFWQRTLDLALLTDPRTGDAAGLEDAAVHYHVAQAADAGMLHPTHEYLAWLDALQRAGSAHGRVRAGNAIQLDPTSRLQVLAPPQQLYPPHEGDTTASDDLILRLETPGLRALLLGSADAYALDALAGSGQPLDADLVELALVPGQPLDLTGPLGDVLRAAHPRLMVICDAPIAPGSKTAQKILAAATGDDDTTASATLGAAIYRTSAAGTISLDGGAGGWALGV